MARTRYLRFLFSAADQAKIDASTLTSSDSDYNAQPVDLAVYPQSWQISFGVLDKNNAAIGIVPFMAGEIRFVADNAISSGIAPGIADISTANYGNWPTKGTLVLTTKATPTNLAAINSCTGGIEVKVNTIWYYPVLITSNLLFSPLFGVADPAGPISTASKKRISQFLAGTGPATYQLGSDETTDDVATLPLPQVVLGGPNSDQVTLTVSAALGQTPYDGDASVFAKVPGGPFPDNSPSNPRFGAVPARHAYRTASASLIGGESSNAVATSLLQPWPQAIGYAPIRFTRIWQPNDEFSVRFPFQTVTIRRAQDPSSPSISQRLAAHGVFYLAINPQDNPSTPVWVSLSTASTEAENAMLQLDGSQEACWQSMASASALVFNLTQAAASTDLGSLTVPHVVLRRRMAIEMLADKKMADLATLPGAESQLNACTYISMRRAIRALVDLRITGGRLNYRIKTPNWGGRVPLMQAAWTQALQNDGTTGLSAGFFDAYGPSIDRADFDDSIAVDKMSRRIMPYFVAFFPDNATQQPNSAYLKQSNQPQAISIGAAAYNLWQSNLGDFQSDADSHNYADSDVGNGAAGAIVSLGIGAYTATPDPGEDWSAFSLRLKNNVDVMLAGLQPGAVLQFWTSQSDYVDIKKRAVRLSAGVPVNQQGYNGHSLVFVGYFKGATQVFTDAGILNTTAPAPFTVRIWDQHGVGNCPVLTKIGGVDISSTLAWDNGGLDLEDLWLGANWTE